MFVGVAIEGNALVAEGEVSKGEELELEVSVDPAYQALALYFELEGFVEDLPLSLHLFVYLTADVLVGTDYGLTTAALTYLLIRKDKRLCD